jgi:hypothetical protein
VAQAVKESGLDYTIFAPTGFFNDMAEFFFAAQNRGTIRLFGDGQGRIKQIILVSLYSTDRSDVTVAKSRDTINQADP